MNYEWQDVTGECEVRLEERVTGQWHVQIYHKNKYIGYADSTGVAILSIYNENYKCLEVHPDFRIERRVELPEFKWTPETVAAIDWSKKSEIETTRYSFEHWDEQIERAKRTGKFEAEMSGPDCPNCKKHLLDGTCKKCSLHTRHGCCDSHYGKFTNTRTLETAIPVRDFIKSKLDELEKAAKWEPKVGDKVRYRDYGSGFTVFAFRNRDDWPPIIIFNPNWHSGHNGYGLSNYRTPLVPGYPKSFWWVNISELSPYTGGDK